MNIPTTTRSLHTESPTRRGIRVLLTTLLALGFSVVIPVVTAGTAQAVGTTWQIQSDLAGLNYLPWSGIDGSYGAATTAAAKTFQGNRCLNTDGKVGTITWFKLTGVVKLVQAKVGVTADGLYGSGTKSAVQRWQSAHGLPSDGIAGPTTMRAMGLARTLTCSCKAPVVSLRASGVTEEFTTYIDLSGVVTTSDHWNVRGPVNVGAPDLTFTLCYVSGFWRVASVTPTHYFSDAKINFWKDASGGRHEEVLAAGWGVWVGSISSSGVSLVGRRCSVTPRSITALGVARGVLSLPWPGPYAVGVGQSVVSALLPAAPPDTYYCGDMGSATLGYSVGSDGSLAFSSAAVHFYGAESTWETPCRAYRYCGETVRDIITVSR